MQTASAGAQAVAIRSVSFTADSLARVGVELVDGRRRRLRCFSCREHFSVAESTGGGFAPGWYLCPNGCNLPGRRYETVMQTKAPRSRKENAG